MSFHYYSIDGYGICDYDNACIVTKERIEKLLTFAPEVAQRFHETFGTDYDVEDLDDYESDYTTAKGGFALLCDVMNEAERSDSLADGVEFVCCDDFDCRKYVLYVPTYPWRMSDRERRMISSGFIGELFHKYATILYGMPPIIDYYTCENGG